MKEDGKLREQIILAKIRLNDPDAYREIYDTYVERIYRFIFFKVSSHEEAEDIAADVFFKTWQYVLDNRREIKSLSALLYQIARNTVIDYYRKKSRIEIIQDDDFFSHIADTRQQTLLSEADIKMDMQRVQKVLRTLKDEYKDVVILRYVEELSINEISKILNKSKGHIRVILHRAIKIIKEKLEPK